MAHKTHRPTCKIMTLAQHVTEVLRNCSYHTRALRHIRPLLTFDVAKTIAHSIVSSRLDYANALLHGTSASNRDRLQNSLARAVYRGAPSSRSYGRFRGPVCSLRFANRFGSPSPGFASTGWPWPTVPEAARPTPGPVPVTTWRKLFFHPHSQPRDSSLFAGYSMRRRLYGG